MKEQVWMRRSSVWVRHQRFDLPFGFSHGAIEQKLGLLFQRSGRGLDYSYKFGLPRRYMVLQARSLITDMRIKSRCWNGI